MKKCSVLIAAILLLTGFSACSNPSSGSSGSSNGSGGSNGGGGSGSEVIFTGVEKQNGMNENLELVQFSLTDIITFYQDGTWTYMNTGSMPMGPKKSKVDFIMFAGTYTGNPSTDGSVTLVTKKMAKKTPYIPDSITNETIPLEDLEESKWKTDTIKISGGKFSDFKTVNEDSGQTVEFTRQ